MTTTEPSKTGPTFTSLDPRDGTVLGEYPVAGPEEVGLAVERARAAARWWANQGARGRREWLLEYKRAISSRAGELAALISAETGKPDEDATLEVMLAVSHLEWAAKNAHKVLRRRPVSAGLMMANQAAYVEYQPYGVVGAIGPWNYPVFTPMGTLSYAMAAGNAVVFKPSELTPGVGVWLAEVWDSLGASQPLIQTITGDGSTGAALCRAGVDKLAFTGSAATGRKVMAACAETLTPVVIEGGGKDALLVDADADLDAAAEQAVFGAMGNAGQTCAGVERVYVHKDVHEAFVHKFTAKVRALNPGTSVSSSYGPMTLPTQVDIIRGHIKDALARGGRAVLGGEESVGEKLVEPVVLVEVPEDSTAVTEETFGPTVVIDLHRQPQTRPGSRREARRRDGVGQLVPGVRRHPRTAVRRIGRVRVRSDPRCRWSPGVLQVQGHHGAEVPGPAQPHDHDPQAARHQDRQVDARQRPGKDVMVR